jgi:hypothetical protein
MWIVNGGFVLDTGLGACGTLGFCVGDYPPVDTRRAPVQWTRQAGVLAMLIVSFLIGVVYDNKSSLAGIVFPRGEAGMVASHSVAEPNVCDNIEIISFQRMGGCRLHLTNPTIAGRDLSKRLLCNISSEWVLLFVNDRVTPGILLRAAIFFPPRESRELHRQRPFIPIEIAITKNDFGGIVPVIYYERSPIKGHSRGWTKWGAVVSYISVLVERDFAHFPIASLTESMPPIRKMGG